MLRTVRQISLGIIREPGLRRMAMGGSLCAAAVLLFAGSTFLSARLEARPPLFLVWWAACGWLTLLAILLALFDLHIVRRTARAGRRELLRRMAADLPSPDDPAADDPGPRPKPGPPS